MGVLAVIANLILCLLFVSYIVYGYKDNASDLAQWCKHYLSNKKFQGFSSFYGITPGAP